MTNNGNRNPIIEVFSPNPMSKGSNELNSLGKARLPVRRFAQGGVGWGEFRNNLQAESAG